MTQIYTIWSQIWTAPTPEIWQPKNIEISARFCTTLQHDRQYLWNSTRRRQSENGVASFGHSRTGELQFGVLCPQTAKNRTRDVPDIRFRMAGYPAVFLLSGSGSGPVVPRNRISEPDNSNALMWHINLTKLLVCSGLKPFLA